MNSFNLYFWIFVVGSFLGFLCETIWCMIKWKKIESRKGLIYGHFIPIYGIATVFISLIVNLLDIQNYGLFFIVTFFICAVVEYISSLFQEKVFGTKSWDYSKMIGNLHGRINLLYLSLWSIMGIGWCKYYPRIINLIFEALTSINLLNEVTIIAFILMLYNCYISIIASYRQKLRRRGIKPRNQYELWLDKKYNDEVLEKIYANAKAID